MTTSVSGDNWDKDVDAWGRVNIAEHHDRYFVEGSKLDEWLITDTIVEVRR